VSEWGGGESNKKRKDVKKIDYRVSREQDSLWVPKTNQIYSNPQEHGAGQIVVKQLRSS